MSTPTATTSSRTDRSSLAFRIVGALALGFSAYLHFKIASHNRPWFENGGIRLSGLFVAQAIAATVVSLWVLVQGIRLAWLAFGAVAIASLVAVVTSTYVEIPAIGPLPKLYDPVWYDDKVLAAVSAGIASIVALVALATARRTP